MSNSKYSPMTNGRVKDFSKFTRQQRRRVHFNVIFRELKTRYGYGMYSWGGELTRRAARRIARRTMSVQGGN